MRCYICMEDGGDTMHGGCACRAPAGFVHVQCLMRWWETRDDTCLQVPPCSVCQQPISGDCFRCLQMEHSSTVDDSDTPEQRVAKLHSASVLLHATGDHEMAEGALGLAVSMIEQGKCQHYDTSSLPFFILINSHIASCTECGDYDKARQLVAKLLDRSRGDLPPSMLSQFLYSFGNMLAREGNIYMSQFFFEQSLKYSLNEPTAVRLERECRYAVIQFLCGKGQEARARIADVLTQQTVLLGSQHEDTYFTELCHINIAEGKNKATRLVTDLIRKIATTYSPYHALIHNCRETLRALRNGDSEEKKEQDLDASGVRPAKRR